MLGEGGVGWIPYVLHRMDLEWEDQFQDLELRMKPSEYWHRQFYATYQTDPVGDRSCSTTSGEDNVMWGSDFPHPDGIWPDSQDFLSKELTGRLGRGQAQDRPRQRAEALPAGQLVITQLMTSLPRLGLG